MLLAHTAICNLTISGVCVFPHEAASKPHESWTHRTGRWLGHGGCPVGMGIGTGVGGRGRGGKCRCPKVRTLCVKHTQHAHRYIHTQHTDRYTHDTHTDTHTCYLYEVYCKGRHPLRVLRILILDVVQRLPHLFLHACMHAGHTPRR